MNILCDDDNKSSINLAEKLGFELELRTKGLISKPGDISLSLSKSYVRFNI